jgi:hypothetical protein
MPEAGKLGGGEAGRPKKEFVGFVEFIGFIGVRMNEMKIFSPSPIPTL